MVLTVPLPQYLEDSTDSCVKPSVDWSACDITVFEAQIGLVLKI